MVIGEFATVLPREVLRVLDRHLRHSAGRELETANLSGDAQAVRGSECG